MLSPREAFKFGFLLRCADEGLDEAETQQRIKLASLFIDNVQDPGIHKQAMGTLGKLLGGSAKLGLLGMAAGGGLGLAGGYMAGKLTDKEVDPDDIKQQELIAAYQQEADKIRRNAKLRMYRNQQKSTRSPRKPSLGLG